MTFTLDSAARILAGGSGDLLSLRGCQIYLAANGYELDDRQMHAVMKRAAEYRRSLRHPPLTNQFRHRVRIGGGLHCRERSRRRCDRPAFCGGSRLQHRRGTNIMSVVTPFKPKSPRPCAWRRRWRLLDQAIEQGAGIEVMAKLMDLEEKREKILARKAFDAAIADAKNEMPVIVKNRSVDFTSAKGRTNYKHEDLAEIARTIDPILGKFGLSYRFRTNVENGTVVVTCIVSHRDGHSEENSLPADIDTSGNKNHLQAVGSAVTYLSRYTLKAALGLAASNDDDGQAAGAPLNHADPRRPGRSPARPDRGNRI